MSDHWDEEVWAWCVTAAAWWLTLAGYPRPVQYKLAVMVHRCLWHRAPKYLVDYCLPVSEVSGRNLLCSTSHQSSTSVSSDLKALYKSIIIIIIITTNWLFLGFVAALLEHMLFLSRVQQSATHCLTVCTIRCLLWTITAESSPSNHDSLVH